MFARLDKGNKSLVRYLAIFAVWIFSAPSFAQLAEESMTPRKISLKYFRGLVLEENLNLDLPSIPKTSADLQKRAGELTDRWRGFANNITNNNLGNVHELVRLIDEFNADFIFQLGPFYVAHDLLANTAQKKTISLELNRIWDFIIEEYYGNARIFRALRHIEVDFELLDEQERAVIRAEIQKFRFYHREFDEEDDDNDEEEAKRVLILSQSLEKLETQFSNNIDHSTAHLYLTKEELDGVPEDFLNQLTKKKDKFKLEIQQWYHYDTLMRTARRSKTRKTVMRARFDIASEANSDIFNSILEIRQTLAESNDQKHYLDWALQDELLPNSSKLDAFLSAGEKGNRTAFLAERRVLQAQLSKRLGDKKTPAKLEAWDVAYEIEKKREAILGNSFENLEEYFPLDRVLRGMFDYFEKYFGLQFEEIPDMAWWDPSVRTFLMREKATGKIKGVQILDPFPRPNKERWFWSLTLQARLKRLTGQVDLPVNLISGNWTPPKPGQIAFISPGEDLATLCHEWGHGVNDIGTGVDKASISGMRTSDDFVETPSNFFEALARDPEFLQMVSGHYQTNEPLDRETAQKLSKALEFGLAHARQDKLTKSRIDFALHGKRARKESQHERGVGLQTPDEIDRKIRKRMYYAMPEGAFPLSSFSHIATDYAGLFWTYYLGEVAGAKMKALGKRSPDGTFSAAVGQRLIERAFAVGGGIKTSRILHAVFGRNFNACSAALRLSAPTKMARTRKDDGKPSPQTKGL